MTRRIILVLSLVFIFPLICLADFDLTKWEYYKEIENSSSGLVKITVDDELFAGTKSDLSDLRIIDEKNEEVPYKTAISKSKSETKKYYPKILNNSYSEGNYSMVILDFSDTNSEVNRLTINTNSKNFQRNVIVYGGNDNENWNVIKNDAYIYDYTDSRGGFSSKNTTINFPSSIFRFIKLEVIDDGGGDIEIYSVSAEKNETEKIKEQKKDVAFTKKENTNEKATEIYIDREFRGVPVSKILLSVGSKNFNRSVSVYSSLDNKNWKILGSSYVFRYKTPKFNGENLNLSFSETEDQYLKIVIRNNDDKALDVTGIKTFSIFREVIFEADNGVKYRVYYGNKKAGFSKYDFEKYLQYYDLDSAKEVSLSTQFDNPQFLPTEKEVVRDPKSEKIPYLMSGGLIVASLLLLFLVYKFFQK